MFSSKLRFLKAIVSSVRVSPSSLALYLRASVVFPNSSIRNPIHDCRRHQLVVLSAFFAGVWLWAISNWLREIFER